MIQSRSEK
jgi:hypothetical protein